MNTIIRFFRRLYFRFVACYVQHEVRLCTWAEAARLIQDSAEWPEKDQWQICNNCDSYEEIGFIWLERRERITE